MPSLRELTHGRWRAVPVLGITQIVAWGTIFYSPVLIAPLIAAERQWSLSFTMSSEAASERPLLGATTITEVALRRPRITRSRIALFTPGAMP